MTAMERRHGLGPAGTCVCLKCGARLPHRRGVRCEEERCPQCSARMLREGSTHHQLWLKTHAQVTPGAAEAKATR
jgi:NAD-dependent SIR2 family protein deacetylase